MVNEHDKKNVKSANITENCVGFVRKFDYDYYDSCRIKMFHITKFFSFNIQRWYIRVTVQIRINKRNDVNDQIFTRSQYIWYKCVWEWFYPIVLDQCCPTNSFQLHQHKSIDSWWCLHFHFIIFYHNIFISHLIFHISLSTKMCSYVWVVFTTRFLSHTYIHIPMKRKC